MSWTPRQYRLVGHTALVVAVGALIGLAISQWSTDFAFAAVLLIMLLIVSIVLALRQASEERSS